MTATIPAGGHVAPGRRNETNPVEGNDTMTPTDPCHVPIHRGVERWNTLALDSQIAVLDRLIDADMASGCQHSGWHVASREDHPLESILDYLRETLEKCGGAR